jgi:hypothetical protein
MQHRIVIVILLAVAASSRIAAACDDDNRSQTMLSPGILLGIGGGDPQHHAGFLLGGELSVFRLSSESDCSNGAPSTSLGIPSATWVGGYLDGDYDFGNHSGRVTLGPEVGWELFGIDGGLAVQRGDNRTNAGLAVRPVITFGYVQLFARYEYFAGVGARGEVGALLKWPMSPPEPRHRRGA